MMVPAMATSGGWLARSTSQRRRANASPILAEVPSITSITADSCPSGFGPEGTIPVSQNRTATRIVLTCSDVSASGSRGGVCRRAMPSTGFRGMTSWRTASPNASRSTFFACLALELDSRASPLISVSQRATPISRNVRCSNAGSTRRRIWEA
jgi:hypothetical protein